MKDGIELTEAGAITIIGDVQGHAEPLKHLIDALWSDRLERRFKP